METIVTREPLEQQRIPEPTKCAFCQRSDGDILTTLSTGTPVHLQCLRDAALTAKVVDDLTADVYDSIIKDRVVKESAKSTIMAEPPKPTRYLVSPQGAVSCVVIHGAEPSMQPAYALFIKEGLKIDGYVPVSIPQGIGKLVSPLSLKFASDLLGCMSELVSSEGIKRVVCIVRREEIESTVLKHLVHVPSGGDLAAHVMSLGRAAIKRKLGIDVEMYLAQVEGGEAKFFKLEGAS